MKKTGLFLFVIIAMAACTNRTKNAPDVSNIKVDLETRRFDQDFFAIDTTSLDASMNQLNRKYPDFLPVFMNNIVGVSDATGVKNYYRSYKPVFDSAQLVYKDFGPVKKQLEEAFRYVKYYFPSYKTPGSILTVVGPMNSREDLARMANGDYTPNFIGPDFVGVSLQFYLGKNFSLYSTEYFVNTVAPLYRSRRFSKEYVTADVMKLVTDDIFPDKSNTRPLIEQMIEKGKQWWLLDKFMPGAPDSVKTGYTQRQLEWAKSNEGLIWAYIVKNEDLYSINPATIQTYIGEAPFTSVFPQEVSPGNIGAWVGWQILKKFEEKNPSMKPDQIMQTDAKKILEAAKYKPE
jgi:hypothetical protein